MTASDTTPALHLEAPGPGPWTQDGVHFPRPMNPAAFKAGTNEFARFYGMLIDGLQIAYVQGFGYNQLVPAPEGEVPERFQRAEQGVAIALSSASPTLIAQNWSPRSSRLLERCEPSRRQPA
jgi:hypothetical protein